ncbi:MAG TPA: ABC transporter permease [Gemmatimonadaceae bacterium]|nr:ABC transporter permease [Gemmatimonadaceae bacterium]
MRNLKLAFRTLARTPFVTTIAILSLALGIGANTAIYSMFNEVLLQPLPVSHPEQLVNLAAPGPMPGSTSCNQAGDCDEIFSYAMFRDLEKAPTAFSGIAAHRAFGANVAYKNQTLSGQGMYVSGSYFPTLGIAPARGRLLSPSDDQSIGDSYVAVLSYDYWQSKLGADPNIVNQRIIINGQPMTIVGVAPKGFEGTTLGTHPYVFVPLSMRGALTQGWITPKHNGFTDRQTYWIYLFARRKPGVSMERAAAAVNAAYHPIITDVEAPLQKGLSATTMAKFRAKQIVLTDGARGQSSMHKEAKTPLAFLFAVTAIVLLIACANIANLLLARAANRSTEMAVRLSLGATRGRLLAQLLTESIVLALLGGVVSLLVAHWTLGIFMSMLPSDGGEMLHFTMQWSTIAFAGILSIGTGIVFGLFPAIHSTRPDLVSSLKSGSGKLAGTRGAARFRSSLVTVQIALSMALLIGAGLFVKSLANVSRVDLGIKIDHLVTFAISPELNGYDAKRSGLFFQRVEEELSAIPGVSNVTAGLVPLISGDNWGNDVAVQGFKKGPDTDANSRFNEVGPGYFRALGVPVLSGREFNAGDAAGSPKVAIVNEAFAKKFGLGRNAVGKFMGTGRGDSLNVEIVGLVKDSKYSQVKQAVPPVYVVPYRQDSTVGSMNFYVRTSGDPTQTLRAIPALMKRLDPNLPVEDLRTMEQQVKENVFLDRMISILSAAFAALATLLAAIGLYGVLAYSVAQRTKEIGVRMALGADGGRVRLLILRQVAWMTVIGGIIGIGGAIALGQGAQSLLFGLGGHDPFVIGVSAALLACVALLAGYLPAMRASKVDPMQALRYE